MNRGQHLRRFGGLLLLCTVLSIAVVFAGPTTFKSEDFNAYRLNKSVWSVLDLKQNCTISLTGVNTGQAYLNLTAPAGEGHDIWTNGLTAPAIVQNCANENFTAEAKFISGVGGSASSGFQGEGILVYGDANNFIRFDFVLGPRDSTNLFVATFIGGIANQSTKINKGVAAKFTAPMYLRINRTVDVWTVMTSKTGTTFDTMGTFTQAMTVSKIGLYVINAGTPSAPFTMMCDYLQNLDSPIANDSLTNVTPPVQGPIVYAVRFVTAPDAVDVLFKTDEPATGTLEWGTTTGYGNAGSPVGTTTYDLDHRLTASGLVDKTLYHLRLYGSDQASQSYSSGDLTMNTNSYVVDTTSVSDDFNAPTIDTGLWTKVDPKGDATFSITGKQLSIAVPGGTVHEIYTAGNTAPRLVETVNPNMNVNQWILKFNTIPAGGSSNFPTQGLYVEQDTANVMRIDLWSDGSNVMLFVASFTDGMANVQPYFNGPIPFTTAPIWLKVNQGGATWRVYYSSNGTTWVQAWGGPHVMRVTKVGPYAGNSGSAPQAFTSLIDYFQAALPGKPYQTLPTAGATNVFRPVAFSWDTANGAANYRMQVSTVSNFASTVFDSTFASTFRYVSVLNPTTQYYWRVRGVNGTLSGPYSSTQSFTTSVSAPAAPSLRSPADNATGVSTTPTFTWSKPATSTGYRLQIATDSTFASGLAFNDSTLTDTVATTTALGYNTRYFWRVSAKNAGGFGAYSVVWRFTTQLATPPVPTLLSPAKGATNQPVSLTLSWNQSSGASSYWVQMDTDTLFGAPLIVDDSTITGTTYNVSGLANSTVYYWRVRAKNSGGNSAPSQIWDFTTVVPAPAQPSLVTPPNGATGQFNSVAFTWTRPTGTASFHLQVGTDSTFQSGLAFNDSTLTDTVGLVSTLSYGPKYFWRVRAKNAGGVSPWSPVFSFFTLPSDPTVPVQLTPGNGATTTEKTVTLRWTAPVGASSFHLQMGTDPTFRSGVIVDDGAVLDTTRTVTGLNYQTTYYWRVNADNVGGVSPWSPPFSFRVVVPLPAQVNPMSPIENAVTSAANTNLAWFSSSPLVDRYQVDLAADSLFTFKVSDTTLTDTTKMLHSLIDNQRYFWRVRARNASGWGPFSGVHSFTASSAVSVEKQRELPTTVSLSQNYPNPFNPSTRIEFGVPTESHVTLEVYNILGERVATLVDESLSVGWHTVRFDASNLSSGLYIYRLAAGSTTIVHKMMLVK